MEYVAFLFLGLGVLLVLAGVLLQVKEQQGGRLSALEEYASRPTHSILNSSLPHPVVPPLQHREPAGHAVPGPFQFVQNEPNPVVSQPAPSQVAVSVQQMNPRLFEKFAFLYLDSSAKNIYDGAGSLAAFDLNEVNGIRRFGRGVFSYDGFGFYFDHSSGQERFPLNSLKTVGFYPNCVALTFRTNQPVALLFMEETESIRKVLETFRVENAT